LLIGLDCWTGKSTGMGLLVDYQYNQYNLYVNSKLIGLIDESNKKSNLTIGPLKENIFLNNNCDNLANK
jgi:ABC-type transport system involved in cytochrome bd biosynthesis fused ATPase/permease subunit